MLPDEPVLYNGGNSHIPDLVMNEPVPGEMVINSQ